MHLLLQVLYQSENASLYTLWTDGQVEFQWDGLYIVDPSIRSKGYEKDEYLEDFSHLGDFFDITMDTIYRSNSIRI